MVNNTASHSNREFPQGEENMLVSEAVPGGPGYGRKRPGNGLVSVSKAHNRYSLIGPDYAYGQDLLNNFKKKMNELKPDAEIVETVWVKPEKSNFSHSFPSSWGKA